MVPLLVSRPHHIRLIPITSVLTYYSFSVESQGRTLEQLEWVYNQAKPVKASQHVEKVVVQADGKVTEKIVDTSA